jgi:hypothetical protein
MQLCECGCSEQTVSGSFRPGHDQKLRTALEHRVGGLIALRSLVEAAEEFTSGSLSQESYTNRVRAIIREANE